MEDIVPLVVIKPNFYGQAKTSDDELLDLYNKKYRTYSGKKVNSVFSFEIPPKPERDILRRESLFVEWIAELANIMSDAWKCYDTKDCAMFIVVEGNCPLWLYYFVGSRASKFAVLNENKEFLCTQICAKCSPLELTVRRLPIDATSLSGLKFNIIMASLDPHFPVLSPEEVQFIRFTLTGMNFLEVEILAQYHFAPKTLEVITPDNLFSLCEGWCTEIENINIPVDGHRPAPVYVLSDSSILNMIIGGSHKPRVYGPANLFYREHLSDGTTKLQLVWGNFPR